jgi:hypothetical protein
MPSVRNVAICSVVSRCTSGKNPLRFVSMLVILAVAGNQIGKNSVNIQVSNCVTERAGAQIAPAPLTFPRYLQACYAGWDGNPAQKPVVHVQVKRRGEVHCGHVVELADTVDSREWFKVQTQLGLVWAESKNVRLCSGDGRCTCEASA